MAEKEGEGMRKSIQVFAMSIASIVAYAGVELAAQDVPEITGGNYLYIEEYVIGPGMIPSEAVAKASKWVRTYRESGAYKSVRLYIHNTGPAFGLYILSEPKSWQTMEIGAREVEKEIMSERWEWADHSDNLVSEILVE